jgi:hypothetical protein
VKDVIYEEAVAGYSTKTMAFGLTEAALTQRVAGGDIYIDIDRKDLEGNIGLLHDNNIIAEASDVSRRFGMVNNPGESFLEVRKELKDQLEIRQVRQQVRRKQATATDGGDVLFEKPAIGYAISVIDNEGRTVLERRKVYKLLTTSTTTSKGYEKGFRIVAGGNGTSYPMGRQLIGADKPRLKDITVVIERIMDEPIMRHALS